MSGSRWLKRPRTRRRPRRPRTRRQRRESESAEDSRSFAGLVLNFDVADVSLAIVEVVDGTASGSLARHRMEIVAKGGCPRGVTRPWRS